MMYILHASHFACKGFIRVSMEV